MSQAVDKAPEIALRRMREADLPMVVAIENVSFSNPWSEETFRGELQNRPISHPLVILAGPSARVVGYVIYWQIQQDVQVNNIAVHPDFRGRGIGEAALRAALALAVAAGAAFVTMEVRPSNAPALSLYRKMGFQVLGIRPGYYTNPNEDAYVMGLSLSNEQPAGES
jgi:ribosomal-protein-alanine N-acetyltransferase